MLDGARRSDRSASWMRRQALPPGGAVIAYEPPSDDDRRANTFCLISGLNMPVMTVGGFDFTGADCTGWIVRGLRDIRTEPLVAHSMVVAFK
jgi:hypothetical protein